jgi:hypothetical protein
VFRPEGRSHAYIFNATVPGIGEFTWENRNFGGGYLANGGRPPRSDFRFVIYAPELTRKRNYVNFHDVVLFSTITVEICNAGSFRIGLRMGRSQSSAGTLGRSIVNNPINMFQAFSIFDV